MGNLIFLTTVLLKPKKAGQLTLSHCSHIWSKWKDTLQQVRSLPVIPLKYGKLKWHISATCQV